MWNIIYIFLNFTKEIKKHRKLSSSIRTQYTKHENKLFQIYLLLLISSDFFLQFNIFTCKYLKLIVVMFAEDEDTHALIVLHLNNVLWPIVQNENKVEFIIHDYSPIVLQMSSIKTAESFILVFQVLYNTTYVYIHCGA